MVMVPPFVPMVDEFSKSPASRFLLFSKQKTTLSLWSPIRTMLLPLFMIIRRWASKIRVVSYEPPTRSISASMMMSESEITVTSPSRILARRVFTLRLAFSATAIICFPTWVQPLLLLIPMVMEIVSPARVIAGMIRQNKIASNSSGRMVVKDSLSLVLRKSVLIKSSPGIRKNKQIKGFFQWCPVRFLQAFFWSF